MVDSMRHPGRESAMDSLNLITQLEGSLKAAVELTPARNAPDNVDWRLRIQLFYSGDPVGNTSFNLNGYSQAEAFHLAKSIRHNAYIMKEIDDFLWGESD